MHRVALVAAVVVAFSFVAPAGLAAQPLASRPAGASTDGTVVVTLAGPAGEDVWNLAREFARRTGAPFGVETVGPRPQPFDFVPGERRSLSLKGATLGELLDAFVAHDPRYEWREDGGIIVIRPVGAAGDSRDPLNRAVGPQHWPDIDLRRAMDALARQFAPEIPAPAARAALDIAGGPGEDWARQPFSVAFGGGTLLQLLNAVALAHGGVSWHVGEQRSDQEWLGGDLAFGTLPGNAVSSTSLPGPSTLIPAPPDGSARLSRPSPRPGMAQPPQVETKDRPVRALLPLDDERLAIALRTVSQATGTPIGFERKPSAQPRRWGPPPPPGPGDTWLDLAGMAPRQAVARLLQEAPDYEWFEADGMIDVSPRGARDNVDDILNQVVPAFEVTDATIDQLPLAVHGIWWKRPLPPPRDVSGTSPRVTLALRGVTARQVLDAIAVALGAAAWEVEFRSPAPAYDNVSIGFYTSHHGASAGGPPARR